MEYNSFYGGRRGASFVIVKSYKRINKPEETDESWNRIIREDLGLAKDANISSAQREAWIMDNCMVECFSQGGAYNVVNYDEYVIIDTPNKNDKDNGKIYRRGYNYANDPNGLAGAEYMGQIVGPAGMAPHVEMKTYAEVEEIADVDGLVDEEGNNYRKTSGEYSPTENLVPGKYYDNNGNEQFNDAIKWVACSVRDFYSHETTVHIGFINPYLVNEYTASSVSPYYHRTDAAHKDINNWDETGNTTNFDNEQLIVRTDDASHPYFEKWNISIPKGIKGESLNNFRVTTVGECEAQHPGWLQAYVGKEDDETVIAKIKERKILVYDYYNYDRDASGDPVSVFLGDYNMINNFNIDEYGTVTIDYSHDDEDIYKNLFKWVKNIRLNTDTGLFEIEYNYDKTRDGEAKSKEDTKYEMYLTWVKDMNITEDGTVSWTFTTPEDNKEYKNFMKWIKSVSLDSNGHFSVIYNYDKEKDGTPTKYETDLRWLNNVRMDEDGTIHFEYTYGDEQQFDNYLKAIKDVTLDPETGHLEVNYNFAEDADGTPTKYETDLRFVKDVDVSEDGTIFLNFTCGSDAEYRKFLKFIKSVTLDPETGSFDIDYNQAKDKNGNDTHYHTDLRFVKDVEIDEQGTIRFIYTCGDDTEGSVKEYQTFLKTITQVTLDGETGHFTVVYNMDEDASGEPTKYETDLRYINDLSVAADGQITLHYTHGADVNVAQKIKWITETTIAANGTYTVKYNDGTTDTYEKIFKWVKNITVVDDKLKFIYNNGEEEVVDLILNQIEETAIPTTGNYAYHLLILYTATSKKGTISYNGKTGWVDLGAIKDYNGILVGTNIDSFTNPALDDTAEALQYLNTNYPSGMLGAKTSGKVVTIGNNETTKKFYAYDYQNNTWTFLGDLSGTITIQETVDEIEEDVTTIQEDLTETQNTVTTLETNVVNMQSSVETIQTDLGTAQTNIETLQTTTSTLETNMTTAQTNITNLQSDVTTAQTDITNLQSDVSDLETAISNLETNVSNTPTVIAGPDNAETAAAAAQAPIGSLWFVIEED